MSSFYDERTHEQTAVALSELLDGHPVATFVIDTNHVITHWNKACEHLLGWTTQEMVGTRHHWRAFYTRPRALLADLIVDAIDPATDQNFRDKYKTSTLIDGAYEEEDFFPNIGAAGHWLQFTAAPLRGHDGQLVGAIQSLRDVTERRVAENALRQAHDKLEQTVRQRTAQLTRTQQQLVQSDKLASIGQLAAGVAHEINNPIGYIFSNFGTLQSYLDSLFAMLDAYQAAEQAIGEPAVAAHLQAMREQVELDFLRQDIPTLMQESKEGIVRVRHIVQDLKDFSRVDNQQDWVWADLRHGIDSTLNIVANEIKYKADVVRAYEEIPDIECLPQQINQVVMNLLVNAAHAIGPTRGRIELRTGCEGDNVWFSVSDNGSGISPENLRRIFDPFFTTKEVGKGTGLGLSLSYGIVQKHRGRIDVESVLGQGTTFRVTLPKHHPANEQKEATP
ncbi:MAG: diguanylate cyclase [Pseudoduganella sp.]|jgi:signal transduction histidine kinase|nr:diguanylate cyclase [Pseudoduganella sp.]